MKILILDNYDSFTYNLHQMLEEIINQPVDIIQNDKIDLDCFTQYNGIVLSPGPGVPSEAGQLIPVIQRYASTIPMLGVCLGHQAIVEAFGGGLKQLEEVYHGRSMKLNILADHNIYDRLSHPIYVGRYHSWVVDKEKIPLEFEITAVDESNQIMSIRHTQHPLTGVQYHPESILTPQGREILQNWVENVV